MRVIACFIAVFAALLLLAEGAQAQGNKLQFILKDALEKGEPFVLYSLDPSPCSEKEKPRSNTIGIGPVSPELPRGMGPEKPRELFVGWKVLGKTTIKDAETRKKLIEALAKGAEESKGEIVSEFKPHYGIRVVQDGKTFDLVLGFGSYQGHFFVDGKHDGGFKVSTSPQAVFDKVLTDAKVPLGDAMKTEEKVKLPDMPLPGFPNILYNATLLEVPGRDPKKPLLKIVSADYDKDKREIVWLVEMQTDITYDLFVNIRKAWQNDEGTLSKGPTAVFFDKDRVQLYSRDLKEVGQLRNAMKGDRIRLILEVGEGFPNAASMEIRRP